MPASDAVPDLSQGLRRARRRPIFDPALLQPEFSADADGLEAVLPHRGAFLLLDEVSAVDPDARRGAGRRLLDPADPVFADHFPGDPVYPGVLMVEAMAQLALATRALVQGSSAAPKGVRFLKIHEATFVDAARPGDAITLLSEEAEDTGYTFVALVQALRGENVLAVAAVEAMELEEGE